jgi:hypothetical protein
MLRRCLVALVATALPVLAACPGPAEPPACTTLDTIDPATCAPLYPPTYANVYAQTIARSCGGNRSACHSASGRSNMSLTDASTAYTSLLDGRVMPADAPCSELVVRVTGVGEDYQMPKGSALSAAEQCAIAQWVANGAMP